MVSSTPRPQFTPGKEPVPNLQDAGWAPGPVWTGGKSRLHRDSIPDRRARSQSLYRLSYPAHIILYIVILWGPPSYMRSIVDRNVVMRRIPVFTVFRQLQHRTVIILPCTLVQPPCRSGMQAFAAIEDTEGEQWTLRDVPAQLTAESPSYTLHCRLDTTITRPHELAINHQDFTKQMYNEDGIHLTTSRYTPFPPSPQPLCNYSYSLMSY